MSKKHNPFKDRQARRQGAVPLPEQQSAATISADGNDSGGLLAGPQFAQGRPEKLMTLSDLPAPVEIPHAAGDLSDEEEQILALCLRGIAQFPGDRVVLVVGDVEGHSMESAAAMGQVRSAVFAYVTEGHRPSTVLDRTNSWLAAMGTDLLVTCCVIALNSTDGIVEVALAGHPEPLVRLPDGNTRTLSAPANVPLGVGLTAGYEGREHTLEPEAVVMLFSDGLLDWSRPDPPGDARSLLSCDETSADSNDLERLADRILASASETQDRSDDAVLLLAQYKPTNEDQALRSDGLQFPSRDLHGVQRARRFVGERMRSWGLASMTDDLQLVVSEIVTNALVHAGGDVELHLRVTAAHVRLEVRDSESNPPIPTALSMSEEERTQAEHGRGLFIVDALTEGWNSSPNGRGKTVSLNMPIPNNANAPPTA